MSTMSTIDAPLPAVRSHRGTLIALSLVGLIALVLVVAVALPYFRMDPLNFRTYWPRRWWLLLHISTGIVALLTGPVQLWLGITDRRPQVHRRLGTIYLAAVVVSSLAAFYLAFHTDYGIVFGAGLSALAVAWLVTSGMALMAIKRRLIEQHKEWMIRSYVTTTAFVSFRILYQALAAADVGAATERLAIASWFCWAVPLLITEAWLQGKKILAVKAS